MKSRDGWMDERIDGLIDLLGGGGDSSYLDKLGAYSVQRTAYSIQHGSVLGTQVVATA